MAASTSELDILIQVKDLASQAVADMSGKVKASLDEVQSKANSVAVTFGAMGVATLGVVGLFVDAASNEQVAFEKVQTTAQDLKTQIDALGDSDSALSKQKADLQQQLVGVNAKLTEYEQKAGTSKGATGVYAQQIEKLVQQAGNLKDKIAALNGEQATAKMSTDQITESVKQLADKHTDLGFTVEESVNSLGNLLLVTKNLTEAQQLNGLAMDLARFKNLDLATATGYATQIFEGQGKILKKTLGIDLKDGLTNMQAVAQAEGLVAGQAEHFAGTLQGQTDVAKAKMGELAASIGGGLIPALTQALSSLAPIIDRITAWVTEHPKLTTAILASVAGLGLLFIGISTVGGAISGAIQIWKGLQAAIWLGSAAVDGFGVALDFLAANPIVLIVAAIVALGVAIYELITHWQQVRDFTLKIWGEIVSFVDKHWKAIIDILFPGMGSLLAFIVSHLDQIAAAWNSTWGAVSSFFIGIWDGIKNALSSALDFLKSAIQGFVSWANGVFQPILNTVNGIGSVASGIVSAASSAAHGAASLLHLASGGIVSSPTMALIGEAGPEAVIPLSAFNGGSSLSGGGGFGGGAGSIVININGGIFSSDGAVRQIANMIAKQVNQSLRVRNYQA